MLTWNKVARTIPDQALEYFQMVIYASEPEQIWFNFYRTRTGLTTFIGAQMDGKKVQMKVDPDTKYDRVSYLLETGRDDEIIIPMPTTPVEPEPDEPNPTPNPMGPPVSEPDIDPEPTPAPEPGWEIKAEWENGSSHYQVRMR